jgi:hypothetical protein
VDGRRRSLDNNSIERPWRSVKNEELYPRANASDWEAKQLPRHYFKVLCHRCVYQALKRWMTAEVCR